MGRLQGKVAFITGAGRGQGRAHAIRMAEEGADVIAVDICEDIASVPYGLSAWEDLRETAAEVERRDRRCFVAKADVRDRDALAAAVGEGTAELGRLDAVVANAGIWSGAPFTELTDRAYHDMIDVHMHGAYNTCKATVPYLLQQGEGGSITIISSTAGLKGFLNQTHYNMAKHAVVGLMRSLANELAPSFIRANTIHPSSTLTPMITNSSIVELFLPDVENPTERDLGEKMKTLNLLPVPWAEPVDVSHAVVYLASDEARYLTGVCLPVDAGFMEKI